MYRNEAKIIRFFTEPMHFKTSSVAFFMVVCWSY